MSSSQSDSIFSWFNQDLKERPNTRFHLVIYFVFTVGFWVGIIYLGAADPANSPNSECNTFSVLTPIHWVTMWILYTFYQYSLVLEPKSPRFTQVTKYGHILAWIVFILGGVLLIWKMVSKTKDCSVGYEFIIPGTIATFGLWIGTIYQRCSTNSDGTEVENADPIEFSVDNSVHSGDNGATQDGFMQQQMMIEQQIDADRARRAARQKKKGIRSREIAQLPTFPMVNPPGTAIIPGCSICTEPMENQMPVICIPGCMHLFHDKCILQWLENHRDCPLCRVDISVALQQNYEATHADESNILNLNTVTAQ